MARGENLEYTRLTALGTSVEGCDHSLSWSQQLLAFWWCHRWPEDGSELIVGRSWGWLGAHFSRASPQVVAAVHKQCGQLSPTSAWDTRVTQWLSMQKGKLAILCLNWGAVPLQEPLRTSPSWSSLRFMALPPGL